MTMSHLVPSLRGAYRWCLRGARGNCVLCLRDRRGHEKVLFVSPSREAAADCRATLPRDPGVWGNPSRVGISHGPVVGGGCRGHLRNGLLLAI